MKKQDVRAMWQEAIRRSNEGRFDPSGKGSSVHDIFAALVLEEAEKNMRRRGYRAVADELRAMAVSLTAKDGQ